MTKTPDSEAPEPQRPRRSLHVAYRVLRVLLWSFSGVLAAGVLVAALLIALVNTDGEHAYLLRLAQRKATAALGVPVTLQDFKVDVPQLRVDLYGIMIDGAEPYRTPPLFRANHIEASIRIVSLFQLKWYLQSLEVDHPVAWIVEGKNGQSNIPAPSGGAGNGQPNLFNLAIRHTSIDQGEIYYNNRPHAFSGSLQNLRMNADYDVGAKAYVATLAYKDGRLRLDAMKPANHSLQASFSFSPDTLVLHQAVWTSGNSSAALEGTVRDLSNPTVNADYQAHIDGTELRALLGNPQIPAGILTTRGSIEYHHAPSQPLLQAVRVVGDLASPVLWLATPTQSVPLRDLAGHYSLADGEVKMRDFRAKVLGGAVTARGNDSLLGRNAHGILKATLSNVSLADAERIVSREQKRPVQIAGVLDANVGAFWGASLNDLVAKADVTIAGDLNSAHGPHVATVHGVRNSGPSSGTGASMPAVEAQIHAQYSRESGRLSLANSYFNAPGASVVMNGTAGKMSSLSVRFISNDLGEFTNFVSEFADQKQRTTIQSLRLTGKASLHAQIFGSLAAPHLTGSLAASQLRVQGSEWKTVRADFRLSPSYLRIDNGYIAPAPQGTIQFAADAALRHWSFTKNNSLSATANASDLKLANLLRLAKSTVPAKGILKANLRLKGSLAHPEGTGTVRLSNATVYQQPIKTVALRFSATGSQVETDSLIGIANGEVKATATIQPDQRTYNMQISSSGIRLSQFEFLKSRDVHAEGNLQLNANGHGSFGNPAMTGNLQVSQAAIDGHSVSGLKLQVNLVNRNFSAKLTSLVDTAPIRAQANVSLTKDYPATVSLDTDEIPLQPFLDLYSPALADNLRGETQVHLALQGPLKNQQAVTGQLTIPSLKIVYNNQINLSASAPIRVNYSSGDLHLQPATITGTDTNLRMQGTIPAFSHTPMSLQIFGSVDLSIARLLNPDLRSSGSVQLALHSGSFANGGGFGGDIKLVNANISSSDYPVGLHNGNGILTLNGNRLSITKLDGTVGGGTITAQGGVTLQPRLIFDLGMTAKDVRILYPQGVRESVSANLRFTGSTEHALLGGSVGISDVSFTPAFDLMSLVGQLSSGVSTPVTKGFAQDVAMGIAVHSTNTLNPSSRTMSVAGTADLLISGTAANPALTGRINLTGGSMIFHGDRFLLTGGTVQFVNPNQIRPVLNLSLSTTIQQYDIDLRFTGPADQLRGEYTSNPSLPRADIISLLAFGTTTEASATNPTPANQAAESLIASQVSSQVTSRISKIAGISQLSISPVMTSGTAAGPPGAVVTIRQQVTGNLYITFSTNVASTQSETIQGEYKLSPHVAVSATRSPNGGFAVDALVKRSW